MHLEHFMAQLLANLGIDSKKYCTYCPFQAFLGQNTVDHYHLPMIIWKSFVSFEGRGAVYHAFPDLCRKGLVCIHGKGYIVISHHIQLFLSYLCGHSARPSH